MTKDGNSYEPILTGKPQLGASDRLPAVLAEPLVATDITGIENEVEFGKEFV
jgi:hypothetical protein